MAQVSIHPWRAWYADRAKYNSSRDRWEDLPACGLQFVVVYEPQGRRVVYSRDLYGIVDGEVRGFGRGEPSGIRHDLKAEYESSMPGVDWKLGLGIEDEPFAVIRQEAFGSTEAP